MAQLNKDQQLIRDVVDALQLPQQRLAGILDVSFAAIHAWLNAMRSPTPESLARVAGGLERYADTVTQAARQARAAAEAAR